MLKNCEWCGTDFAANVSYQIYCSVDCRTESTKEKTNNKQRERRIKSRVGKERLCATCKQPLSIYNDDSFCVTCIGDTKALKRFLKDIK